MRLSRVLVCAVAAAATALVAGASSPPPAAGEAVTFQADPQHSGYVERGGPQPPLRRRWVAPLGHTVSYPVAGDGRVFVTTSDYYRSGVRVVALSAATGRVLWSRELGTGDPWTYASLAYDRGRVFVARSIPELPSLLALSAADGRTLWASGPSYVEPDPPVAVDGAVYVNWAPREGGVSAWRQDDGALLWAVPRVDVGGRGSPAVWGDSLLVGDWCPPHVIRIRRSDGAVLTPKSVVSGCSEEGWTAVVGGNRAYVRDAVYDAGTSALLRAVEWTYTPAVTASLEVLPVAPVVGPTNLPHRLVARRARDGRVLWRFRGDGYLESNPLIVGRTVYVGSGSGRVFGVDARSGRLRWRGDAGASVPVYRWYIGPPGLAAAEGLLLVPARGRLVAFESAAR